MITYKIHLIRHGRTAESADGLYLGRTDLPLSAAGKQGLLDKAAQFVYPPAQIVYTSPLQRCVQTAALLYPERMTISLDALNECDFGAFTGKSFAQLKELPVYQKWVEGGFVAAPPDGESGMELLSRVKALIRRYKVYQGRAETSEELVCYRDITIDQNLQTVQAGGEKISLTEMEYQILLLLISNPRKVFSVKEIYETVWKEAFFPNSGNTVMVHIRNIRRKLEKGGQSYIQNIWGRGYCVN